MLGKPITRRNRVGLAAWMRPLFATAVFAGCTGHVAEAGAEIVRFKMTGTVMVNDPTFVLPANVVTGAPFTALLTYDTSVPDSLPDNPGLGRYDFYRPQNAFSLSLSVGDLLLRDDPADDFVRIEVLDNTSSLPGISPPTDSLSISDVRLQGGPKLPDPYYLDGLQVVFDDVSQKLWDGDGLPKSLTPPTVGRAEVQAYHPDEQPPLGRPYDISAFVTQVSVIPEPRAILVASIAGTVGILVGCRRESRCAPMARS